MKKYFTILLFLVLNLNLRSITAQTDLTAIEDITHTPSLVWRHNSDKPFFSSPVISGNKIYVGGCDSIFRALDLKTGKTLWEFKTNGEIRSVPLIENDLIWLNGGDGTLYCLNKIGKVVQSVSAGKESKYDFADYHHSSPAIFDNTIFVGLGDGFIYAVNSDNGNLKWKYETGSAVHSTPAVDSSGLYAGSFDGNVYALNISDGSLKWKFKTAGHQYFPKGEVQGSPSLSDDIVFIGARDYNFYAIDKEKGYCHWNKVFSKGWVLANTVNDTILFIEGADERILSAVDPQTGKEYWTNNMEFLMFGKPSFSRTLLYTGTTIGKLHAVNKLTGKKVWTFSTDGYNENRFKYFKEDDSYRDDIYSIIKSNEQFLEVEMELGGIFSTPAIKDGYIVVTCSDGTVYCLKQN